MIKETLFSILYNKWVFNSLHSFLHYQEFYFHFMGMILLHHYVSFEWLQLITSFTKKKRDFSIGIDFIIWTSGVARAFGESPTRRAKMRKKMRKVWGKIKNIDQIWGKSEKSGTLAHLGLWGWLWPWFEHFNTNINKSIFATFTNCDTLFSTFRILLGKHFQQSNKDIYKVKKEINHVDH